MSAPLPPRLQAMVDELAATEDLELKYDVLIELGKEVPDIPAERKAPDCLVQGCQSVVHVYATVEGGKLRLHGHADALIINGLLALLVLGLDGLTPEEFLKVDPKFIEATGVIQTLTPSRVNGFYNIHEKLKAEALIALGRAAQKEQA
jgi:cysteine desulfuration protein SufE